MASAVTSSWRWPGPATSSTLLVPDQTTDQDFQWRLADQGGMLWTDNMAIPKGAQNKAQAEVFIDWYYVPTNAAEIEAYVNYVCPVKGADEVIVEIDPTLATNPLIFPHDGHARQAAPVRGARPRHGAQWEAHFATAIGPEAAADRAAPGRVGAAP